MGKVGRPSNPDSPYTMQIHKNGKYRYASTQRQVIDKNGDKKFKHFHWGTVDEQQVFHPNHSFLYQSSAEQKRFIFPDDWNLTILHQYQAETPAPVSQSVLDVDHDLLVVSRSRSYGAVWLMEQISDRLGVRQDLMTTFDDNQAIVDDIMTVAMFLFITNYNLDRLSDWQALEKYPSKHGLVPSAITDLQKSITEQNRVDFLKCRSARVMDKSVLAVDSTTKSGYGVKLIDLAQGRNKEGLKLPVTLEVVVYSISDHVPVYYRTFAGNTYDGRSIDIIMADLKEAGFSDYTLVMDRAYPSARNIDRFIMGKNKIIACMRAGTGSSLAQIKKLGTFDFVPEGFVYSEYLDLYVAQYDLDRSFKADDGTEYKSDRYKLNLYFDPVRRIKEIKDLDIGKGNEREALQEIIDSKNTYTSEEVGSIEECYCLFELKWEEVRIPIELCPEEMQKQKEDPHKRGQKRQYVKKYRLISYERDVKAMIAAKRTAGFRALITLGVDFTAEEAMDHYSLRAEQEMDNEQWKTLMQCDRERNSTEPTKAGASFIQFVGRIMSCYIRYAWRSIPELRKGFKSSLAMIDEMRRIRCIEYPEQNQMRLTPFIGKQLELCKALDIPVPKGCAPSDRDPQ